MSTVVHPGGSLALVPDAAEVTALPGLSAQTPPVFDTVIFSLQASFCKGTQIIPFMPVAAAGGSHITQVVKLSCIAAVYQFAPPLSPGMTVGL